MAAVPPAHDVREAMALCGVDNAVLFQGQTAAQRIAGDVFHDDFDSCMDKTFTELDEDFKTYADLSVAQGRIRLVPGIKNRIKAFVQWVRDEKRLGRDPASTAFPVADAPNLMRRYKTHEAYVKKSDALAEAAKPVKFTAETKWEDWYPTLLNYLRTIPGRDGVPLKYVCRERDAPDPTPHTDFLDDYISMAPLAGDTFVIDANEVHTIIVNLISGNSTAEAKILAHANENNGRLDYTALKNHYEGVGVYALDVTRAQQYIDELFYAGEKRPHMWWDEFEKNLTWAFNTLDKKENRQVYSNEMKLRTLLGKIKADFLAATTASLNVELTKVPMTMTYERALQSFRDVVNQKHPPQMSATTRTKRTVNEVNKEGKGKGKKKPKKTRTDSIFITLTDGQTIEYHPSFRFPPKVFAKFKQEDKERLRRERDEYKLRNQQATQIQELQREIQEVRSQQGVPPTDVTVGQATQVSQITTGTIMGGRNEQAEQRQQRRR